MADSSNEDAIDEDQLWTDVAKVAALVCDPSQPTYQTHREIDDALREWLSLASKALDCNTHYVAICSRFLLHGKLFLANSDYVRTQIIHSFFDNDEPSYLYPIANFLLLHGRDDPSAFPRMIDCGCFQRLLGLVRYCTDPTLHQLLAELMYEMSRVSPLRYDDLSLVDDGFIEHLFRLSQVEWDDSDRHLKSIIQVLLVLNEQYMVSSAKAAKDPNSSAAALTNRVVKFLSLNCDGYDLFGSNLIFCINRETETAMQLLILKLLYLLFTSEATYEILYTNDLRVLVDIILRNLWDLPQEKDLLPLRHTYLRVLHPLLQNTPLNKAPHYKKDEISRLMTELLADGDSHFDAVDENTERLVQRISQVAWLSEDGNGAGAVARRFLGISLSPKAAASSASVANVAAVTEKAGVQTPHRKADRGGEEASEVLAAPIPNRAKKKIPPEVPRHRHGIPYAVAAPTAAPAPPAKRKPPQAPPPRRPGRRAESS